MQTNSLRRRILNKLDSLAPGSQREVLASDESLLVTISYRAMAMPEQASLIALIAMHIHAYDKAITPDLPTVFGLTKEKTLPKPEVTLGDYGYSSYLSDRVSQAFTLICEGRELAELQRFLEVLSRHLMAANVASNL